jgi:hypothetical protein
VLVAGALIRIARRRRKTPSTHTGNVDERQPVSGGS